MAKHATMGMEKPGLIVRARQFIQEVKVELEKVSWPTKEEIKASTQVVLLLLAILAGIVYLYDVVFQLTVKVLLMLFA